jgi:hypothetical protein
MVACIEPFKSSKSHWAWKFMPVIPATREMKIRRIIV